MNKFLKLSLVFSLLCTSSLILASEGTFEVLIAPAQAGLTSSELTGGGCSGDPYCSSFLPVTLAGTTYGVSTTVVLVLLLKKDDVRSLIERAEMENEVSSELKSVVEQMQAEFKTKSGLDISDEEVLSQLQAQTN